MELDLSDALNEAISIIEKCNKLVEEIRSIENRKRTLQEQLVDSALREGSSEGTTSKEIIGLEKVLESMQEQLNKNTNSLGKKVEELKSFYRERALKSGIGKIAEAVPE